MLWSAMKMMQQLVPLLRGGHCLRGCHDVVSQRRPFIYVRTYLPRRHMSVRQSYCTSRGDKVASSSRTTYIVIVHQYSADGCIFNFSNCSGGVSLIMIEQMNSVLNHSEGYAQTDVRCSSRDSARRAS